MHWSVLHEVLITTRVTDPLHSSKTWGRLTLIAKNRDYSDSFYYYYLLLLLSCTLYEQQLVAFEIHNNFFQS